LNRDISDNTIAPRLRKLRNEGKITRQVCPEYYDYKEVRICYSLTTRCREDLKIKYYKYLPIYITVFLRQYQDILYDWRYVSEKDLKQLVRKHVGKSLDIRKLRIVWKSESNKLLGEEEIYTMLYEPIGCLQIQCEEFEFTVANRQGNLDVSKRFSYSYRLRGVSAEDISPKDIGYSRMSNRKAELFEIKNALLLLEKQRIVTKIGEYEGKSRYLITNQFSVILFDSFYIMREIEESLKSYWKYIKHPRGDVRSWLEYFYPQGRVNKIFNDYYSFKILDRKSDKNEFTKIIKQTKARIHVCQNQIRKFKQRNELLLDRYKGSLMREIISTSIEPLFLKRQLLNLR
jgi:hypothetical protein